MNTDRPQSRDDFGIAIICALPLERDAVEALLDEDYEEDGHSYGKAVGDKNAYTIGRFGKQHVVVAHMPGMGTISAAAVAANLNSSFPKIQVAFVVGVCGGIPVIDSPDTDQTRIFLGDVIVSTSVVQVDFGRQYPDGFRRKKEVEDILGRADPEVRAFVGKMSGYRSRTRLTDRTISLSKQLSSMDGFSSAAYPGLQHDILYDANHRHKHWNSGCQICDRCEHNDDEVCELALGSYCDSLGCQGIVSADTRETRKPTIHFGRIASGNQVIKSGLHRDRLGMREKVIGFEMESAGTWDYVPTIVIKSVCDYADSHKSKRWQRCAAATAAACTKALLEEWRNADRRDQITQSRSISHQLHDALPSQLPYPVHSTVTRSVNTLFTGRLDILDDLKSIITKAVANKCQQEPCHIVISGMGGQGKSEICLQLAHQLRNLFWGIFWVDVSTTTVAENGFLEITGRLGTTASTLEAVRRELINLKQPWLLVLDNADDPEVDYQIYFPASVFGVVILTSRNAECQQHATKWVSLEGLAHIDACNLLLQAARVPDNQRETSQADAEDVAQLLQSHPLALIQAGSYISRGHCSMKDYPRVYDRQRKRLLAFRPTQASSRYRDVYATFEASVETLQLSKTMAAGDALELLCFLAVYGPNRVPVLLFETVWRHAQEVSTKEVPTKEKAIYDASNPTEWHVKRLPAFIEVEAETWDPFRLGEALNLLKAFSLVSTDTGASSMSVSMHPLVHAWARDRLSVQQQHACWVQAGCAFAIAGKGHGSLYDGGQQFRPHLQAVVTWPMNTMFGCDPVVEICGILLACGWLLFGLGDYGMLLRLMDLLFAHMSCDPVTVDSQWLSIYELFSVGLFQSGQFQHAMSLQEQILKAMDKLPEDNPFRLLAHRLLGIMYTATGRIEDAVRMLEQAVKMSEQAPVQYELSLLNYKHSLAIAYQANDQIQDAIGLLEEVVEIRAEKLPENDPDRMDSERDLAIAYGANGQVEDSMRLMERVVKIVEQTLAETHPVRLISQRVLAGQLGAAGKLEQAVRLLESVIKIQEQVLAEHHPELLISQEVLALFLWDSCEEAAAVKLMRKVVSVRQERQDKDHPKRVWSENTLRRWCRRLD